MKKMHRKFEFFSRGFLGGKVDFFLFENFKAQQSATKNKKQGSLIEKP